jgi:hypothetical protein
VEAGQLRHLGTCGERLSRALGAVPAVLAVLTSRVEKHVSCPSLAALSTGSVRICTHLYACIDNHDGNVDLCKT